MRLPAKKLRVRLPVAPPTKLVGKKGYQRRPKHPVVKCECRPDWLCDTCHWEAMEAAYGSHGQG